MGRTRRRIPRILVPLDDLKVAEAALPFIKALHRKGDLEVFLLRMLVGGRDRFVRKDEMARLDRAHRRLGEGRARVRQIVISGKSPEVVSLLATKPAYDLVAVGLEASDPVGSLARRRVLRSVLRGTSATVLAATPRSRLATRSGVARKILVLHDGSSSCGPMLESTGALAERTGARLHLLNVAVPGRRERVSNDMAVRNIEKAVARLKKRGRVTGYSIVQAADVATGIMRYLKGAAADMVAMMVRPGRRGEMISKGKVPAILLERGRTPLLLTRAASGPVGRAFKPEPRTLEAARARALPIGPRKKRKAAPADA